MKTQITKLSAWLALFVVSSYVVYPTYVRAELGTAGSPASQMGSSVLTKVPMLDFATASRVTGHVVKALPVDQNRVTLGAQTPCKEGDILPDGSVVQTGKETLSFAELKWGFKGTKVTRVWQDSMIRIFCGRSGKMDTVCIAKGGLIFKKDKPDTNYYYVETKLLQARIHGTTVRVITDPPSGGNPGYDKLLVLEGSTVLVKNKETGSVVELTPGVELVVKVRASYKCNDTRFEIPELISTPHTSSSGSSGNVEHTASSNIPDYRLNPDKGELLFEDHTSQVMAYTANSKAILDDPLVKGSADIPPIESLDLIETAMKNVPSSDKKWQDVVGDLINFRRPDKMLTNSKVLKICKVPNSSYSVGHNVGEQGEGRPISLPFTENHPKARLEVDVASVNVRPALSARASIGFIPLIPQAIQEPEQEPDQMALKHDIADNVDSKSN